MKSTRLFRNFILLFSLLGLGSLSAVEYKTLIANGTDSETITLQDGDIAEIISVVPMLLIITIETMTEQDGMFTYNFQKITIS